MNDFAELRKSIYLNHAPDDVEAYLRLARALAGQPDVLDSTLEIMARLAAYNRSWHEHGGAYPEQGRTYALKVLHDYAGSSPYIDHYLSNALRESTAAVVAQATSSVVSQAGIVQSLFYGDPALSGSAGGGGLGTLIRSLGKVLAQQGMSVLTLAAQGADSAGLTLPATETLDKGHALIRLPILLPDRTPKTFLVFSRSIETAAEEILRAHASPGSIIHVRYLDDASRAVASAARRLNLRIALTLTPDPHRSVCGPDGSIIRRGEEAVRELFNRIVLGDELLLWAHGLVGIGRDVFINTLPEYFPQLENARHTIRVGIDEGVDTDKPEPIGDPSPLLCNPSLALRLDPAQLHKPAIICVGRLNALKGQLNLARAWAEGPLRERWNLVLIGGELEQPGEEERSVRDGIRALASSLTAGRLCHVPSQDNATVRSLLAWWGARRPADGSDLYVCPSLKEEFGLSILEAMASGLPCCAPLNGGARSYLRHGINGFLLDTRDTLSLGRELNALLVQGWLEPARLEGLRAEAKRSVEAGYSLKAMATAYRLFYNRLSGGKDEHYE